MPNLTRPSAPDDLDSEGEFRPAHELREWAFSTFIESGAILENPDHAHLQGAHIGFLWTNVSNSRHMRAIAATCELGKPNAQGKWAKARAEQQVRGWFGAIPDFIITVDAGYWASVGDVECCALIEHELSHAAQELDEHGMPKFSKATGKPTYTIRGHDAEEFVGVVRRYGPTSQAIRDIADAVKRGPEIAGVTIAQACGTCMLRAA